jgi:hypothetical protein
MSVQLLLSFDTTGSMYPCLKQLRHTLAELLQYLHEVIPDLCIGVISHGDYCDYSYPPKLDWQPFTYDNSKLISYVNTANATSGGDSDEFYEWVFQQVNLLEWDKDATKIYIPIGDASPHEPGYKTGSHVTNIDWKNEITDLASKGIHIVPIQCLPRLSYYGYNFWESLATYSQSPLITLDQFQDVYQIITAIALAGTNNVREAELYVNRLHEAKTLSVNVLDAFKKLNTTSELIGGLVLEDKSVTYYKQNILNKSSLDTSRLQPVLKGRFQVMNVRNDTPIKSFVESESLSFKIGRGFYQLTKTEVIQENKEVVLLDSVGNMYTGEYARDMIHAPLGTRKKISKYDIPYEWQVFIQSTSSNRRLIKNSKFLYEV